MRLSPLVFFSQQILKLCGEIRKKSKPEGNSQWPGNVGPYSNQNPFTRKSLALSALEVLSSLLLWESEDLSCDLKGIGNNAQSSLRAQGNITQPSQGRSALLLLPQLVLPKVHTELNSFKLKTGFLVTCVTFPSCGKPSCRSPIMAHTDKRGVCLWNINNDQPVLV